MSNLTGKCDLYDYILIQGANLKDNVQKSILESFEIFKKRTNGVIYQRVPVKLNMNNFEFIKEHCNLFSYNIETNRVPDKRRKTGYREKKHYTFIYFGNIVDIGDTIYITKEIHFDTILDIIQYLPYICSSISSDINGDRIFISANNYNEETYKSFAEIGVLYDDLFYRNQLSNEILKIVKEISRKEK